MLGLQLPDVEPETDQPTGTFSEPPSDSWVEMGRFDLYREVFDPVYDDGIVVSSLGDDLSDIYRDLKGPLLDYDNGSIIDAIWSWKFCLRGHCGDHLVDALRVIHRLVNDHMPQDYDPSAPDSFMPSTQPPRAAGRRAEDGEYRTAIAYRIIPLDARRSERHAEMIRKCLRTMASVLSFKVLFFRPVHSEEEDNRHQGTK